MAVASEEQLKLTTEELVFQAIENFSEDCEVPREELFWHARMMTFYAEGLEEHDPSDIFLHLRNWFRIRHDRS